MHQRLNDLLLRSCHFLKTTDNNDFHNITPKSEILVMLNIAMTSMATQIVDDTICFIIILIPRIEPSRRMSIVIVTEHAVNVELKRLATIIGMRKVFELKYRHSY